MEITDPTFRVTREDFAWIATHGLNAVRIPIGHWIFGPDYPYHPKYGAHRHPFVTGGIEVLDRALDKDPERRYPGAEDLAKALRAASDEVVRQVQGLRPHALKMPVHTDYLDQTYP